RTVMFCKRDWAVWRSSSVIIVSVVPTAQSIVMGGVPASGVTAVRYKHPSLSREFLDAMAAPHRGRDPSTTPLRSLRECKGLRSGYGVREVIANEIEYAQRCS